MIFQPHYSSVEVTLMAVPPRREDRRVPVDELHHIMADANIAVDPFDEAAHQLPPQEVQYEPEVSKSESMLDEVVGQGRHSRRS